MQISYNKLFKLLIDKGMKKTNLAKEAKLTPATLAKLSKQETVSMDTLIRICDCLDCTYADACLDRVLCKAYRLEFKGESLRN